MQSNTDPILVTGGAGFIGSAVVRHLVDVLDRAVVVLDALTYAASVEALASVSGSPKYVFVEGDIRDPKALKRVFMQHHPSAVINLAAETHVDRSIDDPTRFVETNALGTAILVNASRRYWSTLSEGDRSGFRFVQVSTDEVFGEASPSLAFTEDSPYRPRSPYAASKASGDHIVKSFYATFGLPAIVTNGGNSYGPFQFPDKLVPHMIACGLEQRPLPIYGNGLHSRDWIHVDDHAEAICSILDRGNPGDSYLIGANCVLSNKDVVFGICGILDELSPRTDKTSHAEHIAHVSDRPGHDRRYAINADNTTLTTGWRPRVHFAEGLRRSVRWYVDNREWLDRKRSATYKGDRLGVL